MTSRPLLRSLQYISHTKSSVRFLSRSLCVTYRDVKRTYGELKKTPEQFFETCCCSLVIPQIRQFSISNRVQDAKIIGQCYEDGKLIYLGKKGGVVKGIQFALYSVGALLVLSSNFLLGKIEDSVVMQYILVTWIAMFGVINPMMYYKFCKRYVEELYYDKDSDKYTAYVISPFIFGNKKVVFSAEECRMPSGPSAFASFLVHKKPMLVSSDGMDYDQYAKMLRYATEFDYENPERQMEYKDAVKESIDRITALNKDNTSKQGDEKK